MLSRLDRGGPVVPSRADGSHRSPVRRLRIDRWRPAGIEPGTLDAAFFRHAEEFDRRWPGLTVVSRERFALLAYPLSGRFTGRKLLPDVIGFTLARGERILSRARDQVRQHHHIKGLAKVELLAPGADKIVSGESSGRVLDHPRSQVDADAARRL
jgi:hypothetical protein